MGATGKNKSPEEAEPAKLKLEPDGGRKSLEAIQFDMWRRRGAHDGEYNKNEHKGRKLGGAKGREQGERASVLWAYNGEATE